MKTFDLNAYGVSEMSYDEMSNTDGGWVFLLPAIKGVFVVIGVISSANAIYNFGKGVVDGYNE